MKCRDIAALPECAEQGDKSYKPMAIRTLLVKAKIYMWATNALTLISSIAW